jgi:hypothetical protein
MDVIKTFRSKVLYDVFLQDLYFFIKMPNTTQILAKIAYEIKYLVIICLSATTRQVIRINIATAQKAISVINKVSSERMENFFLIKFLI